jgi:hypothetical protein
MGKFLRVLMSLLINCLIGFVVAGFVGAPPWVGMVGLNLVAALPQPEGVLSAKLTKEIWLSDLIEAFYPDWSFLSAVRDMSAFVENDKINFAEVGVEPNVLVNNTTYPVPFADRSDTPLEIVLDYFDTEGTVLRNADLIELAYDKRNSVVNQHKNALLNNFSKKAIHAYAPVEDDTLTPVIAASGAVSGGVKSITFKDIINLKTRFDMLDAPMNRVLVLNPIHENQLVEENLLMMRSVYEGGGNLFGFKIFRFSKTPTFNKTTGEKVIFDATAAPSTDTISSVAFLSSEVMRAQGSFDMFERLRDPEQKGDIINFQMRGIALPVRNKYIGAIYSGA